MILVPLLVPLLLPGVLCARQAGSSAPAVPTAPRELPPPLLQSARIQGGSFFAYESPDLAVSLRFNLEAEKKRLRLHWSHKRGEKPVRREQAQELDFTPTAACRGDAFGVLFVGGTTPQGTVRIVRQEWTLPNLDGSGALGDSAQVEAREVYSGAASAGDVYHLLRNRGDAGSVFVELWEPRAVHRLDLASGELTRVAALAPAEGCLAVEPLAERHDFVFDRDHETHGYLYFFARLDTPEEDALPAEFVLRDSDRDGSLDDVLVLDLESWKGLGLDDEHQYRRD